MSATPASFPLRMDLWMENALWFKLNGHLVTDEPGKHRLQMFVVPQPQ